MRALALGDGAGDEGQSEGPGPLQPAGLSADDGLQDQSCGGGQVF